MGCTQEDLSRGPIKAVIHCDVDCFYCQVETHDNAALAGRPLAVHQGNSGGFVAVNYEARAAGVRCGDGSDPGNLAARTFQREMPNANRSLAEVRQLCPDLITKPMRSDRYRQVSAQLLELLSQFASNGQCEKTSYDDFYLEIHDSPTLQQGALEQHLESAVHIVGGGSMVELPAILRHAVQVVRNIKAAVQKELGFTMSFGIAEGKLAARLAGPLHKPSGITVVPPNHAAQFLLGTPIIKVPLLRGQLGKQVTEQLLVEHVQDLAAYDTKTLVDMFGASTGQLLFDLGHAIDNQRVQAKAPQQSIACTKSYHGLRDLARVCEALHRLVFALWPRLLEERSKTGRVPAKLKLACKQGGREQAAKSYTLPFPAAATRELQATALGSVNPSLISSAAVHTLIPNLAPRSRLGTGANAAAPLPQGQSHAGVAEWDESSGPHQLVRQAMFDAAMDVLKPKLAHPVLVNFLSVAGEYVKDSHSRQAKASNSMLRFLQQPPHDRQMKSSEETALGGHNLTRFPAQTQGAATEERPVMAAQQSKREHSHSMHTSAVQRRSDGPVQASKRHRVGPLDSFVLKQ